MKGSNATEEAGSHIAAINIIPLVDVVLVLLIIFMITAVFTREAAMKLDLPKASPIHALPPVEVTVDVDPQANITVNGVAADIKDMGAMIDRCKSSDPNRKTLVVLRGSNGVFYGKMTPILDEIGQTGLDMTLAVKSGPN